MASYNAIAATSRAILGVLEAAVPKPEFDGATFELYQAMNFQNPMAEGISLYLYRVASSSRRNLPPRLGPAGQHYRPPLPLDLYYLLTAWGKTAEKQQRLLGFCIRELGDLPILPPSLLNHYGPEPTFRSTESVELLFEPLTLQDIANLWEPLKPNIQASATYVARMVALESVLEVPTPGPVQTRELDLAGAGEQ